MTDKQFPIEAGHIMMFARSVGDPNQIYYDAAYAEKTELGSIIAPPTFIQASAQFDPDYGLRPKIGQPWHGSGGTPSGVERTSGGGGGTALHAEQHYEYHRHPQPGDVLSATSHPGETWEREGRRAGKMTFQEHITEYRDQDGELVIVARSVTVLTGRPVEQ